METLSAIRIDPNFTVLSDALSHLHQAMQIWRSTKAGSYFVITLNRVQWINIKSTTLVNKKKTKMVLRCLNSALESTLWKRKLSSSNNYESCPEQDFMFVSQLVLTTCSGLWSSESGSTSDAALVSITRCLPIWVKYLSLSSNSRTNNADSVPANIQSWIYLAAYSIILTYMTSLNFQLTITFLKEKDKC